MLVPSSHCSCFVQFQLGHAIKISVNNQVKRLGTKNVQVKADLEYFEFLDLIHPAMSSYQQGFDTATLELMSGYLCSKGRNWYCFDFQNLHQVRDGGEELKNCLRFCIHNWLLGYLAK
jgi:hypothetical protein